MPYPIAAYSNNNADIYTSAFTATDEIIDADNPQMVVCTITMSSLHTDQSEITISTYVNGVLLNGQAASRIKAAGETTVHYQLDPVFVLGNDKLRIDVASDNSNDTSVTVSGTKFKTLQSEVRLWNDSDVADVTDTDKLQVSVQHKKSDLDLTATEKVSIAQEANGPNTWYVTTGGNDGNAGASWAAPFATISKAIDEASSGDTIRLGPGTHSNGGDTITVPAGVSVIGRGYTRTFLTSTNATAYTFGDGCETRGVSITSTHVLGTAVGVTSGEFDSFRMDECSLYGVQYGFTRT